MPLGLDRVGQRKTQAPGHDGLLTLALKVHAAAVDGEPERLERAARRFSNALADHLDQEALLLSRLAPPEARILRRGQDRLATTARFLIGQATGNCQHDAVHCSTRTEELVALLVLQARDERCELRRP
jgi:hypothetical protein